MAEPSLLHRSTLPYHGFCVGVEPYGGYEYVTTGVPHESDLKNSSGIRHYLGLGEMSQGFASLEVEAEINFYSSLFVLRCKARYQRQLWVSFL